MPLARIPLLVPCRFLHFQVLWIEAAWVVTKVTDLKDVIGLSAPRKLVPAAVRNEGQVVKVQLLDANFDISLFVGLGFGVCQVHGLVSIVMSWLVPRNPTPQPRCDLRSSLQ
jgi:hypothetical protein